MKIILNSGVKIRVSRKVGESVSKVLTTHDSDIESISYSVPKFLSGTDESEILFTLKISQIAGVIS